MNTVDMIEIPIFEAEAPGYEEDFCAWSFEQARRLRAMRVPGLDSENLAEEIESLGRREKREIGSRMAILLGHLLKWCYHFDLTGRGWASTIHIQRREIVDLLEDSPSLRPSIQGVIDEEYQVARKHVILETGMFEETYPAGCPWTEMQILNDDVLPLHPAEEYRHRS